MKTWFWSLLAVVVLLAVAGSLVLRFAGPEPPAAFVPGSVRLGVVNACGRAYLASSVARELEKQGFVVYGVGNADRHRERTAVVDLLDGEAVMAHRVAEHLAVRDRIWLLPVGHRHVPEVRVEIDSSRYLEVLVVVGDDYRRFFPGAVPLR